MDKITFKNLPFTPLARQVIYIESAFDAKLNTFIMEHYDELRLHFLRLGKEFYYLPLLTRDSSIEQKVLYSAPYLSSKVLASTQVKSSALLKFATDIKVDDVRPALIFNAVYDRKEQKSTFCIEPLGEVDSVSDFVKPITREILKGMACEEGAKFSTRPIQPSVNAMHAEEALEVGACPCTPAPAKPMRMLGMTSSKERYSRKKKFTDSIMYSLAEEDADGYPTLNEIEEEEMSLMETQRILRELKANVQRLRLEGVSLMAIHEFIDRQETLSPMVITEDYRIFLPAYNNMEIEMGALPKALYFLFLRYPEGIVCKHMQDYYSELLSIYRQLRPKTDEARLNLTITKVVNPLGNALNENIARIRKAFVEKFDEHLAANYIITGERSQQYSIPLDRNLITWEE